MRRLFVLMLILALSTAAVAAGADRSLVLIHAQSEQGPDLTAAGVELAAEIPGGFLAFLPPDALARLDALAGRPELDLSYLVIAADDPTTDVLVRYAEGAGDRIEPLTHDAVILHRGPDYAIMRLPTDEDRLLPPMRDTQRIFRQALRFVDTSWEGPRSGELRTINPDIQAMVETVDVAWLEEQVQTLEDFGNRHSQHENGGLAAAWLLDQFISYGYLNVTFHSFNDWNDNVVCVKLGTVNPSKWVVIGGHYDSIGSWSNPMIAPGADDNATGTVAVLAAARALRPYQFEYSIAFIAFSGEEQGLYGSTAWANLAADNGMDIEGALIADMLGYRQAGDAADIDIIFNTPSQPLRTLVDDVIDLYVPQHVAVDGYLPGGASSDHASFWNAGFRAILFFEDSQNYSPYIHSANDLIGPSVNDLAFMNLNVRTMVAATAVLAQPVSGTTSAGNDLPVAARLQAHPNPFNPQTTLSYTLPRSGQAELEVYDARGRLVARPLSAAAPAGAATALWNAEGLASGLYLVRLQLDGEVLKTTKLMLAR